MRPSTRKRSTASLRCTQRAHRHQRRVEGYERIEEKTITWNGIGEENLATSLYTATSQPPKDKNKKQEDEKQDSKKKKEEEEEKKEEMTAEEQEAMDKEDRETRDAFGRKRCIWRN